MCVLSGVRDERDADSGDARDDWRDYSELTSTAPTHVQSVRLSVEVQRRHVNYFIQTIVLSTNEVHILNKAYHDTNADYFLIFTFLCQHNFMLSHFL